MIAAMLVQLLTKPGQLTNPAEHHSFFLLVLHQLSKLEQAATRSVPAWVRGEREASAKHHTYLTMGSFAYLL